MKTGVRTGFLCLQPPIGQGRGIGSSFNPILTEDIFFCGLKKLRSPWTFRIKSGDGLSSECFLRVGRVGR